MKITVDDERYEALMIDYQITEIARMCKLRYSLSNTYIPHLQELSYDHASFLKT